MQATSIQSTVTRVESLRDRPQPQLRTATKQARALKLLPKKRWIDAEVLVEALGGTRDNALRRVRALRTYVSIERRNKDGRTQYRRV